MKCKFKYLKNRACWIYFHGLSTCIWTKNNNTLARRHVGYDGQLFLALGTSLPLPFLFNFTKCARKLICNQKFSIFCRLFICSDDLFRIQNRKKSGGNSIHSYFFTDCME